MQSRPALAASAYAGEFLAMGGGARALALGSAYVAVVDDATAGYWNAAALTSIEARQLHVMHTDQFSGLVQQDYLAVALPGSRLAGYGVSLLRVGVNDIKFTRLQNEDLPVGPENRPLVSSTETSSDYALYFSGGRRFNSRLSVGGSVKLIYRTVGAFNAYGAGLDLGLRYHLATGLTVAANLRDVTTTPIKWENNTDRIQPSFLIGLAYDHQIASGRATLALASRAGGNAEDESGSDPVNAGVEYWRGKLALRAGFEGARQALGLGIAPYDRLNLDLAYLSHDELEATYRLSAGLRF